MRRAEEKPAYMFNSEINRNPINLKRLLIQSYQMETRQIEMFYSQTQNYLSKGNFENALNKLKEFIDELPDNNLDRQLIILSGRYNTFKRNSNIGIIEGQNESNILYYILLDLLDEAKQIAEDTPKMITNVEEWSEKEQNDEIYGNPNHFVVLFKVVSSNLKKSTKAMQLDNGCIIQVTTERRSPDGAWSVAEAVSFVPGAKIVQDNPENIDGKLGKTGHHLEYRRNI